MVGPCFAAVGPAAAGNVQWLDHIDGDERPDDMDGCLVCSVEGCSRLSDVRQPTAGWRMSDLDIDKAVEALKACRTLDGLGLFEASGYDKMFDRIFNRVPTDQWWKVMDQMKSEPR